MTVRTKPKLKENERSIKLTGVYIRRLEQRYMEEQKEIEEMNQTQQPSWLVNNILFCYEGEKHTSNDSKKKQHKGSHSGSNDEAYIDGSKSTGRKLGFAAVFLERRGTLPDESSIHTAEMTTIKIAMRGKQKREDMRWEIHTDSLSSTEQQRKPSNIKSDI